MRGGYTFDQDSTSGNDWDYQGHRLDLGLRLPASVTGGWVEPSLKAELTLRFYENPNSRSTKAPPEKREDTIQTYTLVLSRTLTKWLSGSVQYLYNNNASNIRAYRYDRQIVGFTLTATY